MTALKLPVSVAFFMGIMNDQLFTLELSLLRIQIRVPVMRQEESYHNIIFITLKQVK